MTIHHSLISSFKNQNILIIGDAILDIYWKGSSNRLCREAPVPIVNVHSKVEALGGAANTAVNITALGGRCTFCSYIGADQNGKNILYLLEKYGINSDGVFVDTQRETLTKSRILSEDQLVVRYDIGGMVKTSEILDQECIQSIIQQYRQADAIILSDYEYGTLSDNIRLTIQSLMKKNPKPLIVDAKNLSKYRELHPTLVKPNYGEVINLLKVKATHGEKRLKQIQKLKEQLFDMTGAEIVAVTFDSNGALIFEKNYNDYRTYTKAVQNLKTAGAGDTYVAAFSLALAENLPTPSAAEIAAGASAVAVQKEGTSTCSAQELMHYFVSQDKKVARPKDINAQCQIYKQEGKKIVFTNGCFDILHSGHVTYLNQAKDLGDILIVGVNTDESVKKLKGPTRPINSVNDRMEVLSGLSAVDHVIPFGEDTPIELIKAVKPDIFVKGGDYTIDKLPEVKIVEDMGGTVKLLSFLKDRSTTKIIKKIQDQQFFANS